MGIEQYIAMYAPVVLTILGYFPSFIAILKSLKSNSKAILESKEMKDLKSSIDLTIQQNRELKEQNKRLLEELTRVIEDEVNSQNQKM